MPTIPSRWEWRAFAESFGPIEPTLRSNGHPRTSHEVYILSSRPEVNAKLRDDTLDVKLRHAVDPHGLELWSPAVRATFPVDASTVQTVLGLWRLPVDVPTAGVWRADAFLERFVSHAPSLRVVSIDKVRYGSRLNECIVEIADVWVNAVVHLQSIGVEHEDPARVWDTVTVLDLQRHPVTNYVAALTRAVATGARAPCR